MAKSIASVVFLPLALCVACGAPNEWYPDEPLEDVVDGEPPAGDPVLPHGDTGSGDDGFGGEGGEFHGDEEEGGDLQGGGGPLLGAPIDAPPLEWTWIEFPESRCADGSPTGLGINLSPGASTALIFFEGGGACWDYSSCFGLIQTSFHLGGFDERSFNGLIAGVYRDGLLFDREDERNAFADAHHVFIPYCTGDAFSGDAVVEMSGALPWANNTIHFAGHRNVMTYLERLVPTFADVDKVVLTGSSAGGFGAGLSWGFLQEAFGEIRVDVLDDSGPPIPPGDGLWQTWVETWNMQLPEECTGCLDSVERIVDYYRATLFHRGNFGLVSHTNDIVISSFFDLRRATFEEELLALAHIFDEEDNAQYFIMSGITHATLVMNAQRHESNDGFRLWQWIEQMVNDDPEWASHRP